MIDAYGRWYPDYQGQQMYQDPAYMRGSRQPQIQQSGFVSVRSTNEVESWPIAPGNSLTFYVEGNPPVIATKTKGFSQLEMPVIKYFDLTERQNRAQMPQNASASSEQAVADKVPAYALKTDLSVIWDEIKAIKEKLKEANNNDAEQNDA